jgi:hypothetical protein
MTTFPLSTTEASGHRNPGLRATSDPVEHATGVPVADVVSRSVLSGARRSSPSLVVARLPRRKPGGQRVTRQTMRPRRFVAIADHPDGSSVEFPRGLDK